MPKKKAKKKVVRKAKKHPAKKRPAAKKKPRVSAKKAVKKAKKRAPAKKAVVKKEPVLGTVTHYFPHVNAAVIKLKGPLTVGETIKIKGHTTDLTEQVTSMQIDRVPITQAKKGQEIGLLVASRVRQHDLVYKA